MIQAMTLERKHYKIILLMGFPKLAKKFQSTFYEALCD